jgi:hypothetical protein
MRMDVKREEMKRKSTMQVLNHEEVSRERQEREV